MLRAATEAYSEWLRAEPLQRLYVVPRNPIEEDPSWGRVEQRGQSMMLAALPEMLKAEMLANRATSTVEVLFRIFTRYQPGGLGERALLLRTVSGGQAVCHGWRNDGTSEGVEEVAAPSGGASDCHPRSNFAGWSAGENGHDTDPSICTGLFQVELCKSPLTD